MVRAVLAQKFCGYCPMTPFISDCFYRFSETEKIRTPYRPTFFQLAFESGGNKWIWGHVPHCPNVEPPLFMVIYQLHTHRTLQAITCTISGLVGGRNWQQHEDNIQRQTAWPQIWLHGWATLHWFASPFQRYFRNNYPIRKNALVRSFRLAMRRATYQTKLTIRIRILSLCELISAPQFLFVTTEG